MRTTGIRTLVAGLLLATGLATAAPASAITGGEPAGEEYGAVGWIFGIDAATNQPFNCSGALVADRIVLTAAHCVTGYVDHLYVTFEPEVTTEQVVRRDGDNFLGYGPPTGAFAGTGHPYTDALGSSGWGDVGVVLLETPVLHIDPLELADVGTLDARSASLHKTVFDFVGYGRAGHKAAPFPMVRRTSSARGQKLDGDVLTTHNSVNPAKGTGGICSGDSGGPVLLEGQIVAVVSYANGQCNALSGHQRVDVQPVRDWLAAHGV